MQFGWHFPDPLALTTGVKLRLAAACGVVAAIWLMVAWSW